MQKIFSFVVPSGRIFYIKTCRVIIETLDNQFPAVLPSGYFPVTISVDGNSNVFSQNVLVDTLSGEIQTHIIAGQGQTVSVSADFEGIVIGGTTVYGITQLVGDMLLPNDQAVPFTATAPR